MKKLSVFFIGANLLFSLPVSASFLMKKKRSFDCQSDHNIESTITPSLIPEFLATVRIVEGHSVDFVVKKNVIVKDKLKTLILASQESRLEDSNGYLTVQGTEWALAIAPEKKRASLYNMNPDVNEVPMFCLSPQ